MRILWANITTEEEIESLVGKMLNDLHTAYRQRRTEPGREEYARTEQAIFTQLRLVAELFPASRKTRIRAKLNMERWTRVETKTGTGIQVIYDGEAA